MTRFEREDTETVDARGSAYTPEGVPEVAGANLTYWQTVRSFSLNARLYLLYMLFNGINFGIFTLDFNLYLNSLGYHNDFVGFINALPAAVILLIGLPVGYIADRVGYRPFLLAGATIIALASLLPFSTGAALGMMLFAIALGVGRDLTQILGQPFLAAASTARDRVHLFSVNSAIATISLSLGILLGGAIPEIVAQRAGVSANSPQALHGTFIAMTLVAGLGMLPLFFMRPTSGPRDAAGSSPTPVRASSLRGISAGLREIDMPVFVRLLLPEAIVGLGAGALVVFFQLYFHQRFGLAPGPTALILAFSAAVTGTTQLCGPLLAARIGKVRTLVVLQISSVPFLLILAFTNTLAFAIVAYYFRDALMNAGWPVGTSFAMERVRANQRATLASLDAMLGSAGRGGLGPLISGFLQRIGSYNVAFSFTAVLYLLAAGLYFGFWRNAEQPAPPDEPAPSEDPREPAGSVRT